MPKIVIDDALIAEVQESYPEVADFKPTHVVKWALQWIVAHAKSEEQLPPRRNEQ